VGLNWVTNLARVEALEHGSQTSQIMLLVVIGTAVLSHKVSSLSVVGGGAHYESISHLLGLTMRAYQTYTYNVM